MRVIRDFGELPELPPATAVTIGNFDGVHRAHQNLLRRVIESARRLGAAATVVTFDPHPSKVLTPDNAPKLLTPLDQKTRLLEKEGIDLLIVLPFTQELAHYSPAEFVRTVLVEQLHAVSVHVGPNFRFGHRQAGDVNGLKELARREGFLVEVTPILEVRGQQVSSSRIRDLLSEGRVQMAGRLLGRPFSCCGPIVAGLGVGRKQTVPTLNLAPFEEQLPKIGVYVTRTRLGGTFHESVTNVGHKPTFGEHRLTVESYLLEFDGEIHEAEMEIEFLYRLRDEMKFPDPAALKTQIQKDARRALKFFRLLRLLQQQQANRVAPTTKNS